MQLPFEVYVYFSGTEKGDLYNISFICKNWEMTLETSFTIGSCGTVTYKLVNVVITSTNVDFKCFSCELLGLRFLTLLTL